MIVYKVDGIILTLKMCGESGSSCGKEKFMLLRYQCDIKTSLTRKEIVEKLKMVTILKKKQSFFDFMFVKLEDFIFFKGEFEDAKFSLMPLPTRVPPYSSGNMDTLLPIIRGNIIPDREGSIVKITASGRLTHLFFLIFFNTFFLLGILSEIKIWKIFLMLIIDIAVVLYFYIVAKKVKALFEKILH